jgi:hypothetical protein
MKNLGVSGVSFAGLRDESPHDQSAPFVKNLEDCGTHEQRKQSTPGEMSALLIRVVCSKKFNQEILNSRCGAQIAWRVVGDAWDRRSGLVGKAMHCTAVDNKLPVDTGMVHFFDKRTNVRQWNMGIQSAMANHHLGSNRPSLRWFGPAQASVHANYTGQFHPAARQFKDGHSTEAVAHRCDLSIDFRSRRQDFYACPCPLA